MFTYVDIIQLNDDQLYINIVLTIADWRIF